MQLCNSQVHIKCNQTDVKTYNKLIDEKLLQICIRCKENDSTISNQPSPSNGHCMVTKTQCGICIRTIAKNHRNIQCHSCKAKVPIKCNKTDVKTYNKINKENLTIFCFKCETENIPTMAD